MEQAFLASTTLAGPAWFVTGESYGAETNTDAATVAFDRDGAPPQP